MFSYIRGTVKGVVDNQLILEVYGIGFSLLVPNHELFQREKEITVATYLQWNQEQGPTLYGFSNDYEKAIFILVIGCSGIGPKIALLILQNLSPTAFLRAIQTSDIKALSSISGIGPKKAEQLIVQLKHKVTALIDRTWDVGSAEEAAQLEQWKNITQVLQSLNYSRQEIDQALSQLSQDIQGDVAFDVLMRKALSFLAKKV